MFEEDPMRYHTGQGTVTGRKPGSEYFRHGRRANTAAPVRVQAYEVKSRVQAYNIVHFATTVVPGVVFGLLVGYVLGGWQIQSRTRLVIIALLALIGGVMVALGYRLLMGLEPLDLILAFMSFVSGVGLGSGIGWVPEGPPAPKRHVRYDPDEDDREFDRQLRESLGIDEDE